MKILLFPLIILILVSCGKKPDEIVDGAIDVALSYLSADKCQAAIDLLEEVKRQNDNAVYLEVLASAYACRAGFNELDFIATDIPTLVTTTPQTLFKSLVKFSESAEHQADSSEFTDLKTSMGILLNADGAAQPSHAARVAKYGTRKAGDMGVQILLMGIYQMGKFLHYYGDVNAAGSKGLGASNTDEQGATPSVCFLKYTYAPAVTYVQAGNAGPCVNMAINLGHPDLSLLAGGLANTKRRMCEGLMILNNIVDTLSNMTLPTSASLGNLSQVKTLVSGFKTTAIGIDPALTTLLNTTSQTVCEATITSAAELNNMQYIFALVFDTGLI